jgi:hypothetical protein
MSPDLIRVAGPTFDSAVSAWGIASANSGQNFIFMTLGRCRAPVRSCRKAVTLSSAIPAAGLELVIKDGVTETRAPDAIDKVAEVARLSYTNQVAVPEGSNPVYRLLFTASYPTPYMIPTRRRTRAIHILRGRVLRLVEVDVKTGQVMCRYLIVMIAGRSSIRR